MPPKRRRRLSSGGPDVMMDINTTPLIDVMLVLLVMLIITIPIQLHAVNLDIPIGTPPTSAAPPPRLQIDIDERSIVYWQGVPVGEAEFDEKMTQLGVTLPQPEIHLRPSKDCQYAVFAHVLATSKRNGLSKIAVIGHEQFLR